MRVCVYLVIVIGASVVFIAVISRLGIRMLSLGLPVQHNGMPEQVVYLSG